MSLSLRNRCDIKEIIPQSYDLGICWFNSILTICLYSQGCRNVLIEVSDTWDKKNKILMILKKFLYKYYYKNENEIRNFFKKLSPEFLLLEFLRTFDVNFLELNKRNIHHVLYEGWYLIYIIIIFKALQIDYKDIIITDKYKYENVLEFININLILNKLKIEKQIEVKNSPVLPNIIVLSHKNQNSFFNNIFENDKELFENNLFISEYDDTNLNEEFIYEDVKYKLDACIIRNYNNNKGHIIAGITCNNKRYVYDGLMGKKQKNPCKLYEFDWNININNSFIIRPDGMCDLEDDIINNKSDEEFYSNQSIFSFNKGAKLLIYVREDYYNKINNQELEISITTPFIDKNELLDYIYNYNDLETLVKKLKKIYVKDITEIENIKDNIEELRNFIINKIIN